MSSAASTSLSVAKAGALIGSPVARALCGLVRGAMEPTSGSAAFLGIPYALAPTGKRRWQPPTGIGTESAAQNCWTGELAAVAAGPACLQAGKYSKSGQSDEDCLHLHVHTRNMDNAVSAASMPPGLGTRQGTLKPVLVWLHGGGLLEGSPFALQSGFGAQANLTSSNEVIVVSVQYRLGVAGFLSLAALSHEHDVRGRSGNYGLLDCLEALRWVQKNIQAFGGDPGRVTVWGQSSGGSLVLALLASPLSQGLLHRAISMSGSPRLNSTTDEAANYWHRQVVARTRCASIGFSTLAESTLASCLLSLSAEELLASTPDNWHEDAFSLELFQPEWQYAPLLLVDGPDGALPRDYLTALADPWSQRVPLILGVTRQESDFAPGEDVRNMTRQELLELLDRSIGKSYGGEFVHRIAAAYGLIGDPRDDSSLSFQAQRTHADILTDVVMLCPNMYLAGIMEAARMHSNESPVFVYVASRSLDKPFCVLEPFNHFHPPYCPRYAFHAMDEFAMLQPAYSSHNFPYIFSEADVAFGSRLRARFLEFVASGDVKLWHRFAVEPAASIVDLTRRLPARYYATELGEKEAVINEYQQMRCNLWLQAGFYDSRGLINVREVLI